MKGLGKIAIVVFCLWHMFAIAIYVIPEEETHEFPKKIEALALPYVRPYMYATSQWQKWNIFSPNPIRRVTSYFIEIETDGEWRPLLDIHPRDVAWWKRSRELKILRRTEENGENAIRAYLAYVCRIGIAPRGAHIRLRREYYVIPTADEIRSNGGWKHYEPHSFPEDMGNDYCR